jgi:hypothetical protein
MRLSSRRIRVPKASAPQQIDITKLSPSQYTPRLGISGLTKSLRIPTAATQSRASPSASAKTFFNILQTGTSAEIKQALDVASSETLAKKDRAGNNAYHYLARNVQLDSSLLVGILYLYGDDIEYTANKKGETPLSIVLKQEPEFKRIHVFLSEETDFNRSINKNETIVHRLFKNENLPIEDLASITTQLLQADINKDKLVSALPVLAQNLVNRYIMLSPTPTRVGMPIKGVPTENELALKLFNDFALYIGFEERNKPIINNTLVVLKANAEGASKEKIAFIKKLTKSILPGRSPQIVNQPNDPFKEILEGGRRRRKTQGASRAPRASRTKSTK